MSKHPVEIYRSGREAWVASSFGVVIVLIGLSGLLVGDDPIFPAVLVAFGVLWLVRCWRGFRLDLTESHLVVKRFHWSARIALDEIVSVDTAMKEPGVGRARRCFRVGLHDGTVRTFPEINGSDRPDRRNELDGAIERVRAVLS